MEESSSVPNEIKYPEPEVFPPLKKHRHSFIILHGRGGNASNFGAPLLHYPALRVSKESQAVTQNALQTEFPNAKFIIPTAAPRRAEAFSRVVLTQWFDLASIRDQSHREGLQYKGLRETTKFIHDLLKQEIALVGADNVVLWGLSQGCAASLTALLLWEGEKLGACVGMCGWLPLRERMQIFMNDRQQVNEDDPFDREAQGQSTAQEEVLPLEPEREAVQFLAELIEFDPVPRPPGMVFQKVPVFLGHGKMDIKVPVTLGQEADMFLTYMGATVRYEEYKTLGHWYSEKMLGDIVDFLHEKLGIKEVSDSKLKEYQIDSKVTVL